MIEINLLPEEAKKKKRSAPKIDASMIDLSSVPVIKIFMAAIGAILVIQLALFIIGVISGATFKSLKLEYRDIMPKKQETENLKKQVDVTYKKVTAIDELMVKRFSWEKKLNSLSDSIIPGIWLTELQYNEKLTNVGVPKIAKRSSARKKPVQAAESTLSRYLILSGAAFSKDEEGTAVIGRFMKSLKDDTAFYSDFSDIELGTIKREDFDGQEIMTFKITCFFKAR